MHDRRDIGHSFTGKHAFLCALAGPLDGERVLDLGCGIGWLEDFALREGCTGVVGVDSDEVRLDRARAAAPAAVFVNADATALPGDLGSFGVVAMFDFVEHLPQGQVSLILREAVKMLEPDGRLLISVPYRGLISTMLDATFYFGHRHYKVTDVAALLAAMDYRVVRVFYGGGLWEHVSMLWLYFFKWVLAREMPGADFLEKRRRREYRHPRALPRSASATMFVEAARAGAR